MKKFHSLAITTFMLLLASVFYSQISKAIEQQNIEEKIHKIYIDSKIGAVSYVLVEKGVVLKAGGFGQYSLHDKTPVTENSVFRVGSITKTFTAIAVMQQVEKKTLRLDQAIKSIVKDIPLNNPYSSIPVTLEMLLEHTSGLQDLNRKEFSYPKPLSLKDAFKVSPAARKILTPPGYHFNYSNAGAGYLGRAIEVVNQVNYDDWFESEILRKLGMHHSSLIWSKAIEAKLVSGYDSDLHTKIPYWHTLFRPFGGLNTTAMDMSKLLLMFTTNRNSRWNQIISSQSIKRIETPTTSLSSQAGVTTGYGLAIRNQIFRGHRIYGHGGDGDGYLAQFSYSKESGRGYFYVFNAFRHDIDRDFTQLLDNWLIEDLDRSNKKDHEHRLSITAQQKIVGSYFQVTTRFSGKSSRITPTIHIKIQNGHLKLCRTQDQNCHQLIHTSGDLFKLESDDLSSLVIIKAADGKKYLQWNSENFEKIE